MEFKNVKTIKSYSLNELGNKLKEQISNKTDIFATTNIIFPNNKLEQWFKTYWLRTEDTVLMNIKGYSLEKGLLSLIKSDKEYELADNNVLRASIINELMKVNKADEKSIIASYIYDDGFINSVKLFDLANTFAQLFTEYERDNIKITDEQGIIYNNVIKSLKSNGYATFASMINSYIEFTDDKEVILFGFNHMDKIHSEFIDEVAKVKDVYLYEICCDDDLGLVPNLTSYSAPSRVKEIELIHGEICKLVQKEGVNYSDILVYAPDLTKYETEISKTFIQDNDPFPSIPFSVIFNKTQQTQVGKALEKLFEISNKGFFTRLDFTELISNSAICISRDITFDDIDAWKQAILNMNVYRNGKETDDWEYAKRRLVLSKVASLYDVDNNIVELSDGNFMPYSTISLDNESIVKFISLVDDLQNWVKLINKNTIVDTSVLESLKLELGKWFSIVDYTNRETNGVYQRLCDEITLWNKFKLNEKNIPIATLFYSLINLSEGNKFNKASLFNQGITFVEYQDYTILSAKYIFFIGLSSNDFPLRKIRSEIDLRGKLDEVKNIDKDEFKSFVTQVLNASEGFYLSYVNHDLKSDEEFYPSTYILDIYKKFNLKTDEFKVDKTVGIDETREWNELFTNREFKNKDYYFGLFKPEKDKTDIITVKGQEPEPKVKVSEMKRFLTEPLQYKAQHLFGYEDKTAEELSNEYEPISIDALSQSELLKSVIKYMVDNPSVELLDSDNNPDIALSKKIFERFIIENKIPRVNEENEDAIFEHVVRKASIIVRVIKNSIGTNPSVKLVDSVNLTYKGKDIELYTKNEVCVYEENNTRKYFELSNGGKDIHKFLNLYVCALMDISKENINEEFEVILSNVDIDKESLNNKKFKITPTDAYELLNEIYAEMNNFERNVAFPIDAFDKEKGLEKTYNKFIYDIINQNGYWAFFKGKNMFRPYKDLGYSKDNYEKVLKEMIDLFKRLVVFL